MLTIDPDTIKEALGAGKKASLADIVLKHLHSKASRRSKGSADVRKQLSIQ